MFASESRAPRRSPGVPRQRRRRCAARRLDDATVAAAADLVDGGIDFLDDLHGSAEYRRRVTRGLTRRAILEAAGRARQG